MLDRLGRAIGSLVATPPVTSLRCSGSARPTFRAASTSSSTSTRGSRGATLRAAVRDSGCRATIVTELAGSALILTGVYRWLGALWLGGFTLIATFVANRFWEMQLPERFMVENSFFEHLGLVGGFLLVAWLDLRKSRGASI